MQCKPFHFSMNLKQRLKIQYDWQRAIVLKIIKITLKWLELAEPPKIVKLRLCKSFQ